LKSGYRKATGRGGSESAVETSASREDDARLAVSGIEIDHVSAYDAIEEYLNHCDAAIVRRQRAAIGAER
jgi:hypothetical protein